MNITVNQQASSNSSNSNRGNWNQQRDNKKMLSSAKSVEQKIKTNIPLTVLKKPVLIENLEKSNKKPLSDAILKSRKEEKDILKFRHNTIINKNAKMSSTNHNNNINIVHKNNFQGTNNKTTETNNLVEKPKKDEGFLTKSIK